MATQTLPEATIETWPIGRLIPYEKNPRRNDDAVVSMMNSIREFGFKIPVLVKSDGLVVDGHLRLKAAQRLELKTIPVILCDEWTDAQVKAFRLMVNRSATWAAWDTGLLSLELIELKELDFDLSLTGFDPNELDLYMKEIPATHPVSFNAYDESIETEHQCPKCSYRWSGSSKPRVDVP